MKKTFILLTLFLFTNNLFSQTTYTGQVGKYPVELVTYIFSDGVARAFYVYTKFDEPIIIDGTLKHGLLTLVEKDSSGKESASLVFKDFDADKTSLNGTWTDLTSNKTLQITLTKSFNIEYGDDFEWRNRELLQPASLDNKYFKILVSKEKGDFYARVSGVKIFEKRTDKLLQQVDLDCQLWGINNISIGDYNFDGIPDFSVFEQSYAGPNTSSVYFLYNPKTDLFIRSSFEGTSLDFDAKAKRIYEHNQCCAGTSHMNATYKVENNEMVLVEKRCIEYNEEQDDYIEVDCE